ncbi:hypothetical protein [Haloferax sp. DFSO60]|uniref:DUF7576 family protein n=1 Tax=Haloferax sp. DFSO60 TaxID=3388652 RepID=UPI00397E7BDA
MVESYRNGPDDGGPKVDTSTRCTNCGSHIDTSQWFPIVTELEEESVILYTFCDDDCLDQWTSMNQSES